MSPTIPRVFIAMAALTMLPACLAGLSPREFSSASNGLGNAAVPVTRVVLDRGLAPENTIRLVVACRLSRLRRSTLCRDGVWTTPE